MARVEAIPNKCIYIIQAGAHYYIGQTIRGTQRLDEHIREAYYALSDYGIYKEMKHHRMQDLKISYYEAPNYGIDNFQQAFTDFKSEWQSVGQMSDIDFAEIFHIMSAVRQNKIIDNESMGGQSPGYNYIGPSPYHKGKVLMRTMTPDEAYGVFMLGGSQSSLLADATSVIYQEMFDPNWAQIYNNQYKSIYSKASQKELQSFQELILNDIVPILAKNISRINGKNKVNPNSEVSKEINAWLQHKQSLAEKILQQWFNNKQIKCPLKISTQLDFSLLTDYLMNVISRWSYYLTGQSKNQAIAKQIDDFRPVRTSVVWKWSSLKKPHTNWLNNKIQPSVAIHQDYLKYRSFLLFERIMTKVNRWDFNNLIIKQKEFDSGVFNVKNASFHPNGEQTLSAKVHAAVLPCYKDQWLNYYRPMIAKWRKYHNRPDFQELVATDETIYQGYLDKNIYILYKTDKIINSDSFMDWSEITIY